MTQRDVMQVQLETQHRYLKEHEIYKWDRMSSWCVVDLKGDVSLVDTIIDEPLCFTLVLHYPRIDRLCAMQTSNIL